MPVTFGRSVHFFPWHVSPFLHLGIARVGAGSRLSVGAELGRREADRQAATLQYIHGLPTYIRAAHGSGRDAGSKRKNPP